MAERKSFLLRLSPDLFESLQLWARDDLRSLNAQIEFLLRDSLRRRHRERPERPAPAEPRTESDEPEADASSSL